MHDFGSAMRHAKLSNPGEKFVCFKSDVQGAFLNLPAHPLWQLRQVVTVDGRLYIVRRIMLGTRASPRVWCTVSSLMCWIAVRKLNIRSLHVYVDDFFGFDRANNLVFFRGFRRPRDQVLFLVFWEHISCPFSDDKQLHGEDLKIIGFWVQINDGAISIPPSSTVDLQARISSFLSHPKRSPALRSWQQLAGHLNWSLNVFPYARPALTEVYRKTSGKVVPHSGIPFNAEVIENLNWFSRVLGTGSGVRFIDDGFWSEDEADIVVYTDASGKSGLSFVFSNRGFVHQLNDFVHNHSADIFFLELVAILSAVHHIANLPHPPKRILLFSDSLDSVQVFDSLRAEQPMHNAPLRAIAGILIATGLELRVRHIAGKDNVAADLLSRLLFTEFRKKFPSHSVESFSPPTGLLSVPWKDMF